jgi:type I restriction enzyme M protein
LSEYWFLGLGRAPNQISVEFPIKVGSRLMRVDLAVFGQGVSDVQDNIGIIIECKRDSIEPTSHKDGIEQLKSYRSASANAEWGTWTNGKFKAVFRKAVADGHIEWTERNDVFFKRRNSEETDRPQAPSWVTRT